MSASSDALFAGKSIRTARTEAGLTQLQLATQAGMAQSLVSAYERGQNQPTVPVFARLLSVCGSDIFVGKASDETSEREAEHG